MPPPDSIVDVMNGSLTEIAHAKINLALHVRARRDDGYHELESLFVFAADGDRLTASGRQDSIVRLTIGGPFGIGLGTGEDNLVMRAAIGLRARFGTGREGADIHLDKYLPIASGIGGGSTDAAATLRLLCRLWDIAPPADALAALALDLGSDVPACLASIPQRVGGRGEALTSGVLPDIADKPMLLVNPGVPLSTAAIFKAWDRVDRGALEAGDLDTLALARNDLQPPAIALAPAIAQVLALLTDQPGAGLVRMSGSGATCFALFDSAEACEQAAAVIVRERSDWWTMTTTIRDQEGGKT